jgi:hypothetical protein
MECLQGASCCVTICGVASGDVIGRNIFRSLCRAYIRVTNVGSRHIFAFARELCNR